MEFIDFRAVEEERIERMKLDIAKTYLAVRDVLGNHPDNEPIQTLASMLGNQFRRLEEIETIPFDDRPAYLVKLEEQSFIDLLGGLLSQLFVCRDEILNSIQS